MCFKIVIFFFKLHVLKLLNQMDTYSITMCVLVIVNHIFEDAHKGCGSYAKAYQHNNIILHMVLRGSTVGSIYVYFWILICPT